MKGYWLAKVKLEGYNMPKYCSVPTSNNYPLQRYQTMSVKIVSFPVLPIF